MYDDFYFTNKSWWQLADMDIRSYNKLEAAFAEMLDYEFYITQKYYNKYWNSLFSFIQGSQKQLETSYQQLMSEAYGEVNTESELEIQI